MAEPALSTDPLRLGVALRNCADVVASWPPEKREAFARACAVNGITPPQRMGRFAIPFPAASPTWKWVCRFAELMERKLELNRHKGNREGWVNDACSALLDRLDQEVRELRRAFQSGAIKEMPDEAADVANFAMMIADVVGGLEPREDGRG